MTLEQLQRLFPSATDETWHQHKNPDGTVGGWVENTAAVSDTAYVGEDAQVSGYAWVFGNARVYDNAWVFGTARVYDNAWVFGTAQVNGDARVSACADIQWIAPIGSENGTLTLIRHGRIVIRECFIGTLEEFKEAVEKKEEGSPSRLQYEALFPYLDFWFSQPLAGKYADAVEQEVKQ